MYSRKRAGKPIFSQTKIELEKEERRQPKKIKEEPASYRLFKRNNSTSLHLDMASFCKICNFKRFSYILLLYLFLRLKKILFCCKINSKSWEKSFQFVQWPFELLAIRCNRHNQSGQSGWTLLCMSAQSSFQ